MRTKSHEAMNASMRLRLFSDRQEQRACVVIRDVVRPAHGIGEEAGREHISAARSASEPRAISAATACQKCMVDNREGL